MTQEEVINQMQVIFDNLFLEPVTVHPTLSATEVEEWDSLQHVSIVFAVEQAFGISFATGEVELTNNVGEFVDLVIKRHNEKQG